MGSFNTTCAISKAPILRGQKVYVFFLVYNAHNTYYEKKEKNFFSNTFNGCSNNEDNHFSIIGYPLLATYEDYNNYEFEDKDLERLTLNNIKKIYFPNKKTEGFNGYNSHHDYLDIDDIQDMEQLQKMEHSGSLRVKSYHGVTFISKMAIHKDIYENIILKYEEKNSYIPIKKLKKHVNLNKLQNFIMDKIDNNKTTEEMYDSLSYFNKINIDFRCKKLSEKNGQEIDGILITQEYIEKEKEKIIKKIINSEFFYDDNLRFVYQMSQYNYDYEENNDIAVKIINKFCELYIMSMWFNNYNYEFTPVTISGQDFNYIDHANMLVMLSNIVSSLEPEFDETIKFENSFEIIQKKRISIKKLEEIFIDWFGSNEKKYDDSAKLFFHYLNLIKIGTIKSFTIGDNSTIDLFFKENNLIYGEKDGIIVEFYN